jgi:large subunit ribosomal protein L25
MASKIEFTAQEREQKGTNASKRLRAAGMVPGVFNLRNGDSRIIQMNRHDFKLLLAHHTSESLIMDLKIDGGAAKKALLKEVQHDPINDEVLHADFLEISMKEKMTVNIPLNFTGEPVGVTESGGVLEHTIREVEVECLPGDLVESIDVDVSGLQLGDTMMVEDLEVDPSLSVLTSGDVAVASVAAPQIEEEPEEEEAEAMAEGAAEPEVIGEEKSEEEGEETG